MDTQTQDKLMAVAETAPDVFDIYSVYVEYHKARKWVVIMGDKFTDGGQKWLGAIRIEVDDDLNPLPGSDWVWSSGPY